METNSFAKLNQINVSDHLEKKGAFSYLSWPYAVAQLRLADPDAFWEVRRFEGLPYLKTETGYFVEVAVTVQGITLGQIHPVLDSKNHPIFEPSAFDINTSIQRCLVKAIALHGLGLYVYAGEDLPDGDKNPEPPKVASLPSERTITVAQQRFLARLITEAGWPEARLLDYFGIASTAELPMAEFDRAMKALQQAKRRAVGGMSTIVRLVQGSAEWHEHRRRHRNASETPVVLGASPWQTPYQLWQYKLGLVEPEITAAMLHGTQLEPAARAAYERKTGVVMRPLVMVEGEYSASLDGFTLAGDRIVEIKCPVKGRESTLWKSIAERRLPEHYQWQVQHQLMVTQSDIADVFVFDGSDGVIFPVAPDANAWPRIREGWDRFAEFVATSTPPPLTDRDTRLRDDPEWLSAAAAYLELRTAYEVLSAKVEAAKAALVGLTSHAKEQGGGVSVARFWKKGSVEYKRVPQLAGVDLEQYRGASREETRIALT